MFARSSVRFAFVILLALTARNSLAETALIVPPDDVPAYQLSNMRMEADRFGMAEIAIDYSRTRKGTGRVEISGKTDGGELTVMGFPMSNDDSGTIRLRQTFRFGRDTGTNIEIYLTTDAFWAGNRYKCLISNPVRLGNPGPTTQARAWDAEEKAAYEKHLRGKQPPATVPEGYELVTASTTLLPGMPVQAGLYGEWAAAEIIRVENGRVHFKFQDQDNVTTRPRDKWFVVEPAVLERAKADPSQFKTSVQVLPGGRLPLPAGSVPLASDVKLMIGTPLQVDYVVLWRKAYVLNADSSEVKVRFEDLPAAFDEKLPRSKFVIDQADLEMLKDPKSASVFAANVKTKREDSDSVFPSEVEMGAGFAKPAGEKRKSYPVKIPVPNGAQRIPKDLTVEPGTALAACWGRKWRPVTALSENEDGTVNIRWDDYGDAWDCSMVREELIIEDKTVRRLARKNANAAKELKKTLRTWTDSSGQHKIEARFVRKTETEVTLLTDTDREITLQLKKLSEEDQKLLNTIPADVENPFAQ